MGAIKETDKQVEKSPGHLQNLSPAHSLGVQVEGESGSGVFHSEGKSQVTAKGQIHNDGDQELILIAVSACYFKVRTKPTPPKNKWEMNTSLDHIVEANTSVVKQHQKLIIHILDTVILPIAQGISEK